jgi:hypothetical protein
MLARQLQFRRKRTDRRLHTVAFMEPRALPYTLSARANLQRKNSLKVARNTSKWI